jgi:hypothetical protein
MRRIAGAGFAGRWRLLRGDGCRLATRPRRAAVTIDRRVLRLRCAKLRPRARHLYYGRCIFLPPHPLSDPRSPPMPKSTTNRPPAPRKPARAHAVISAHAVYSWAELRRRLGWADPCSPGARYRKWRVRSGSRGRGARTIAVARSQDRSAWKRSCRA